MISSLLQSMIFPVLWFLLVKNGLIVGQKFRFFGPPSHRSLKYLRCEDNLNWAHVFLNILYLIFHALLRSCCNFLSFRYILEIHSIRSVTWREQGLCSDHRTHAPGVYSVTAKSWWILHSSLGTLFETITEACIVEFLREAGSVCLLWPTDTILNLNWSPQINNTPRLCNSFIKHTQLCENPTWKRRLMSPEGYM